MNTEQTIFTMMNPECNTSVDAATSCRAPDTSHSVRVTYTPTAKMVDWPCANPLFSTQSLSVEIENLIVRAGHTDLEYLDLPLPLGEIQSFAGLSHQEIVARIRALDISDLQADVYTSEDPATLNWNILCAHIAKALRKMPTLSIPGYDGGFTEILEGLMILRHWHRSCSSITDYYTLARTAYMCFTGKSLAIRIMEWLIPSPEIQGFEETVSAMRAAMDLGKTVTESDLVKKLRRMYTYFLVQGVLSRMGLETSEEEFTFLSKKANAVKYGSQVNMWVHVADTALYICERIIMYRKTGSVEAFFRDGQECSDWLIAADKILALAPFTANLEPHGTTYFRFLSDLTDAIDKGQTYAKAFRVMGADRSNPVVKKLGALMLLKNGEITKRAAMKSRHAPLGVLIYGHSGVAKSSFTRVLYHAYASIFGLDRDDHYLYTRSPTDEYWSNFDSSMWAIQMDDVAFLKPSATSDIDPTLKELLNVVNNVPYVPTQAALEDKGKTPILAQLVLATTNCENLNASEYFYCPLAVRRRLPYVLEVTPKKQYLQANGVFIEPKSLPAAGPGFPDFWDITVKRLVPAIQTDGTEHATLEVVERFSDIRKFIQHFGAFAKEHRANQVKGEAAEQFVKQVELCPMCCAYKDDCECELQFGLEGPIQFISNIVMYSYVKVLTWWIGYSWVHNWLAWVARFRVFRWFSMRFLVAYLPTAQFITFMTETHRVVHTNKMQISITFLAMLATAVSVYTYARQEMKAANTHANTNQCLAEDLLVDGEESYDVPEGCQDTQPRLDPQGNVAGTTEDDLKREDSTNVWYRDTVELQTFDLPIPSGSLVGKKPEELRSMFARNTVSVSITALDGPYRGNTRGFFYRGSTLVLNAHTLKGSSFRLTLLRGLRADGLTPSITLTVKLSDFVMDKTRDLAALYVSSMPPARDLSRFWLENIIPVDKLIGFGRGKSGVCDHRTLHGVNFFHMPLQALDGEYPVLVGSCSEETRAGDCGTLYMANTPRGFAFVGMHVAGYGPKAGVMRILKSELDALCELAQPKEAVVDGEGEPLLSLQDAPTLLAPHTKSVFRYIESGSAEQFGRLPGFLPKPRSKVCSTPLREVMEEHYGEPCGYGQPAMSGWEPIRNNVVEMVHPTVNYDREILDRCKRAFLKEIAAGLKSGWEGQLVELSDLAAVNGIPGVKFVDKINTNSSMGFPWNKSKKQFLDKICTEKYPEGVDFPEDIWTHVRDVENKYKEGKRVYPIFMGHNKDEAVTHAKRAAKKTRLFAGGPVHWNLVVRKTLLSFVKLVQENKLTFEAGPGTVCQSIEWQELREYLTQFGLERIVAGDYSKFDKRMIADFIMAAYWIIAELHKLAGHDADMYRKIMGIGTDTAYPVMNIRGELVMFYGTNPSGHPLTVIVNSLVNSLYMRYAFAVLGYDVEHFKEHVALMTYGDDNTMGVSPAVPTFTHTAIQRVLGEIGVVYTMADKESESTAYIHIDDVAFLKRKWRYDADIGAYVCPLDEDSIKKSLMCWLPSNTISPEAQMVAVMQSAVNEYFWYGQEVFNKKRAFLLEHAQHEPFSFYVIDSTFPTWQELKERFWGATC